MHFHLPALALALRVLLLAGVDPIGPEITALTKTLVAAQQPDGYWLDNTTLGKIPIWATMRACQALQEYVRRIDAVRETLDLRQEVLDLTQNTLESRERLEQLSNRIDRLERQIAPLSHTLILARRFRIIILLIIFAAIYLYILTWINVPTLVNVAGVIFAVVLTLVGLYDARLLQREPPNKNN